MQRKVEHHAKITDALTANYVYVMYTDESGKPMNDMYSASVRSGQNSVVQQYGRFYSLLVIRWLSELFSILASTACHAYKNDAFFGISEYFETYTVSDDFLKNRKVWPLK